MSKIAFTNDDDKVLISLTYNEGNNNELIIKNPSEEQKLTFADLTIREQSDGNEWVNLVTYCMSVKFKGKDKNFIITAFNNDLGKNICWVCFFDCGEDDPPGISILGRCCPRSPYFGTGTA